jgi:hypothetical protein
MTFPLFAAAIGLAEFAPMIARWLGGDDAEKMASIIVECARRITGHNDPFETLQTLRSDPQALILFQKELLKIEADHEVSLLHDRQSARTRDVSITQAAGRNYRADIMVIAAACGLGMCLGSLVYFKGHLPGEAVGIISTIAGIFGACLKDAYAFEFGSSRGSKEKDSTVAALLEKGYYQ